MQTKLTLHEKRCVSFPREMHSNIYMSKYMPLVFYGHEKNKLKLLMCLIRVSQSFRMVEMTETNNKQILKVKFP